MSDLRTDYERIADDYDEDRKHWSVPRDANIELLAEGAAVLDLGCGTGTYLATQVSHFSAVTFVGADPSEAMLGHAVAKTSRVRWVRAGAERLPFRDGSFSYVNCGYVFHHLDKDAALAEVVRVLGPHGRFRLVNIEPHSLTGWWVFRYFDGAFENDMQRFWPPERIAEVLEAMGCDVDIDVTVRDIEIPVAQARADADRRVISQLAVLDDARYEAGLARLRELDDETVVQSQDGSLTLTATKR